MKSPALHGKTQAPLAALLGPPPPLSLAAGLAGTSGVCFVGSWVRSSAAAGRGLAAYHVQTMSSSFSIPMRMLSP